MPRNFSKYQYETSPRKLEPEYTPRKNDYKGKKSTVKKNKANKKKSTALKKEQKKVLTYIIIGFAIFFGLCYRNAQIDEGFEQVQSLKSELSEIEKENSQLQIAIENNLNLTNVEQQAKELLGMQKLNNKQIVYVTLDKQDYIAPAAENVVIEEETIIQKVINTISGLFK